jgi:uncharacterized delta-60 repeat protein
VPQPSSTPAPAPVPLARALLAIAVVAALVAPRGAGAQSGVLDPTFGNGGVVVTPIASGGADDIGQAVVIQDDDRILVGGYSVMAGTSDDFSLARYQLDGSLDTTFGGTGKVTFPITAGAVVDRAFALVLQSDQRLVLAGFSRVSGTDLFAVARVLPNGQLDPSFDGDGKLTTNIASSDAQAKAIAVQADGKIVVGGYALVAATRDLALARYMPNGQPDTSFDGDGKLTLPLGTQNDEIFALAMQSDQKILAAGSDQDSPTTDMFVARFTTTGALDTTFAGGAGYVRIHFGSGDDAAYAMAVQPDDGKILVAGEARLGTQSHFAIARLTPAGVLDPSFSGDGLQTTVIGNASRALAMGLFESGRIVLAGRARPAGNEDFALARYNQDGTPDTLFSGDGVVTTAIGSGADQAFGVAIQRDRKIVAAGSTVVSGNNDDFAVARYLLDDCGNGTMDPGEECDGGAQIGGDCCSNACKVVAAGASCRPAVDVCDIAEFCDGVSGACPTDAKLPDADGDAVCDLIDICPADPDPGQEDGDGDGPGDACDPCTNGVGVLKPKIKITRYTTPVGDDGFAFSGALDFPSPPALAPAAQGVRVLVEDGNGAGLFDVEVPPGAYSPATRTGWTANGAGTSHTFRSRDLVGGLIDKVKLSWSKSKPAVVKFAVSGKRGAYATAAPSLPLAATMVLDAPTAATGLCGEASFPGPRPIPSCKLSTNGSTLDCK